MCRQALASANPQRRVPGALNWQQPAGLVYPFLEYFTDAVRAPLSASRGSASTSLTRNRTEHQPSRMIPRAENKLEGSTPEKQTLPPHCSPPLLCNTPARTDQPCPVPEHSRRGRLREGQDLPGSKDILLRASCERANPGLAERPGQGGAGWEEGFPSPLYRVALWHPSATVVRPSLCGSAETASLLLLRRDPQKCHGTVKVRLLRSRT